MSIIDIERSIMGYFDFDFPHTHFYDSDLREILKYIRKLVKAVTEIDGWIDKHQKDYEELKKLYDNLLAGNFTPEMEDALYNWTVKHTEEIIDRAIKMVFFGITDDGYFVAYIPDSWDEIRFGTTGLDVFPEGVDFGHLTLTY